MKLYSGCKNSFYITMYKEEYDSVEYARSVCKDSVDGFMMVKTNPLQMHLRNRDGSIAKMCGNGIRCFIHYCYDNNLLESDINTVVTPSGSIYTKIISINPFRVHVRIGIPHYEYIDHKIYKDEVIEVNNHIYKISLINTGVWHGIIIPINYEECLNDANDIYNLPIFKDILNIDIVKIEDGNIYLTTFEKGVGFTLACGTGSAAAFKILYNAKLINKKEIPIIQKGGMVFAGEDGDNLYIIGPSECGE